ncbi:ArsR/SmtB family transcription factor [Priestia aryabhattai]|uniref:ArsR/SmtB family transcription factor n=1 Tax=Priestia aryabhattai TaxID=412384 RepID=UPI001C8EA641|nr:metalloregulator ArsR/SmtB family transcription factor [Priestia aryabhattai]MBY0213860.1 winged helix-turn-helix transcriptional regulator [Priestia aryabhattai]
MSVKTIIEVEKAAQILKLLGDKTRLSMMKLIENNECCVCEFVDIYQTSQPSISQHLRKLKDVELVKERRKGQWIFYSLNKESKYYEFVLSILESVPSQDERLNELEKQGLRISCCE